MGGSDCELLRDGWIVQPANAWSSLAYVVAAAVVLARRHRADAPRVRLGAVALAAVGVGSFAFHGPQPAGAGPLHDGAIVALLVILVMHVLVLRRRPFPIPVSAVLVLGVAGVLYVTGRTDGPLCSAGSLVQPHAGWHVLTAVAAALVLTARR